MGTSVKRCRAVHENDEPQHDIKDSKKKILGIENEDIVKTSNRSGKKTLEPPSLVEPKISKRAPGDTVPLSIWENAVLLVDKPQTWTSFDVCGKIRGEVARAFGVKSKKIKVGHAGTLDPMATGLLIVCVGKGTKSIDSFVSMKKEYSGTFKLGEVTDSYDADGTLIQEYEWKNVTNDALRTLVRDHFLGNIEQLPPMFSAIRVNGKRLYESARKGEEVERRARAVSVERFDLMRDDETQPCVDFWITCSKGTYIRSLAHDLGSTAGCGAHLVSLRRECIGDYSVQHAWNMDDLVKLIQSQHSHEQPQTID